MPNKIKNIFSYNEIYMKISKNKQYLTTSKCKEGLKKCSECNYDWQLHIIKKQKEHGNKHRTKHYMKKK
jgi:hypothetical protein